MMFRLIFITLYILQNIFFTNAQQVITNPPHTFCVPGTATFACPFKYTVIIRSAFYGISPVAGSCSYKIGDCIADATNVASCTTDIDPCSIYFTQRKLSQCNDHFASYVHVEYDCVPIAMNNATQEYDVCQGGTDLTSDYGIIKSPAYPTQVQTTTNECLRAIHAPDNQTIRLWLTDLYIGSTSTNCADDHLFVVDSIQTFRYCGFKRYAYPYLCSSTILIQYMIKTAFSNYRGMRMYYEIVDRSENDGCPNSNGTITPAPATTPPTTTIDPYLTTATPIYVTLGIASPVRSLQLCKGDSYKFECPNNYVLFIIKNILGTTTSDQCEEYDATKHCAITVDSTFMCQQSCIYTFTGQETIASCSDKIAAYQYMEYQCIPTQTNLITNTSCPDGSPIIPISIVQNGRFQSYNYPNLQTTNCTYRLTTNPGYILHFYSLDISLNGFLPICLSNKLTFIENGETDKLTEVCEQRTFSLIYSSCSNVLDLMYTITNPNQPLSKGVELYIESQQRPLNWTCGQPLPTPPKPTTIPTVPFSTPTATPLTNETLMVARDEIEHDICYNDVLSYTCPSGYTFMILGAYYGVKSVSSNKCGFVQGDCVQEALSTITQCRSDLPNCYLPYSLQRRLAYCSDNYADYLHITSQCIPSKYVGTGTPIDVYDICDTNNDIRSFNGIVTSTNFPTFQQTNNECVRSIIDIQDRLLKIWLNELAIPSGGQRILNDDSDSNEPDLVIYKNGNIDNLNDVEQMFPSIRDTCVTDYLMINTPHVAYVFCGTRKLALAPICAKSVQIHYKSTSQPSPFYKGFKLYFEWVEKPSDIICGGTFAPGNTTTPIDEPLPIWAQNLDLSPVLSVHICLGTSATIRCPRGSDYVLSIIQSSYAVSGTGLCEIPTSSHCHQEASLGLTCTQSCFIEYNIPNQLVQCGSQNADYLSIDYECIPTRLPNHETPIDICSSTTTDTIAIDTGMMISPQYPTLGDARTCSKKIQTLNNKLWMIFIVDLFIEGENFASVCDAASLTISDGKDQIIRCGLHQPELVLISCSDIIEFNFISTHYALGYRGFKVYFKTVDVPSDWSCKPNNYTTTLQPSTTTTLSPPTAQILAYGGTTNGTRQYCKFPFTYQGNPESTCLRVDPPNSTSGQDPKGPWCSLTSNFDADRQWGFCYLGVTDPVIHDVCRDLSQVLQCPSGYVIDIITADYAAKPDGSFGTNACIYDQNDCFQSDAPTVQTICAGLTSCTVYHLNRPLTSCQNRQSAYFHIDYTCVPNDIPEINTFDMCSGSVLPDNTLRGFIVSPSYPTPHTDIDCTFDLRILESYQDIYLYLIEMDLNGPNVTGQNCVKDRLIVTADNTVNEMCGRAYTNLLVYTCHASVSLRLIRTPAAIGGHGVKFYFEFRNKPPAQLCPSLPSTTTMSTLTPPPMTTTTPGPQPVYFPDPSPRMLKTLCYPDLSGLLGIQNFQCPSDYVIVIHRAFYGKGSRCDYTSGDCTTEADIIYRTCAGRQSCSVSFINIVILPECNNAFAEYLFVEYQCLPSPTIASDKGDLCTGEIDYGGSISGLLKSSTYPTYTPTQCPNNTLSSLNDSNLVIYMYLIDFNIGSPDDLGQCSNDYLLLSYQCNNQLYSERLCGTHPTKVLFSTCVPTDKIFASYNLLGQDPQAQRGFALLYHVLPKSDAPSTITTPGIPTTTHAVTSPITPSGPGPISTSIERTSACVPTAFTIQCDPGYVLLLHRVQLGVSATNSCTYSPNDCFEDRTSAHNYCGGQTQCYLFPIDIPINACNNTRSNYLYVEHQCIPTRPKLNLDVCSSGTSAWKVEGGAMISSLNYTSENRQCAVTLRSDKLLGSNVHKAFKIYIRSLNLPIRPIPREQGAQCSETDPYIDIDDHELGVTRLCGNSHTRYLLETCSTLIETRFNNILMTGSTDQYKGFEIYFESIQNDECRTTIAPPIQTLPFIIKNEVACALINDSQRVDFSCTPNYGLVFLQSYQFVTENPEQCNVTRPTCFYPSEQPQAQCSGQQACSYTHVTPAVPESTVCQDKPSDSVEFYYQCLPMIPSEEFARYTFCSDVPISAKSGFIETPNYPDTYQQGTQNCSLSIQIPDTADSENDFIYLYIIELSIRDTSLINSSSAVTCFDSIEYTDGDKTDFLCGKIDQPLLKYFTNKKQLNLTLNIPHASSETEWSTWHGARLFYYIANQSLPSPPIILPTVTTTTPGVDYTSTASNPGSNAGLIATIVVVCLLAVLAVLLGFAYIRRRSESRAKQIPAVKYDADMGTIDGATVPEATEKRTSIPKESFKASTFLSPFYSKPETNGKEEIQNETFAKGEIEDETNA